MYNGLLKRKNGSAMLFVLIAITVLSLLGVSLLSLALSGLKVKLGENDIKESQYMSESGLDQAYVWICGVVKAGVDKGKGDVDSFIKTEISADGKNTDASLEAFLKNESKKEKDSHLDPLVEDYDSPYLEGDDGKGDVVEAEVKKLFNSKFKKSFKEYINGNLTKTALEASDKYKEMYAGSGKPNIELIGSIVKYDVDNEAANTFNLALSSEYTQGSITKKLAADLLVKAPDYEQQYTVERLRELTSPFFNKILAADGSIIVKGNNTEIYGDIYAGGEGISTAKGIVLGDSAGGISGSLTVNGRLVTGGDIAVRSDNSRLQANGDIYCSNIRFEDINNGRVTVGSAAQKYNVHTLNSIILDGTGSIVDINGRYYGFSNGSDVGKNRSSIIINDQYASGLAGGTHISISGEAPLRTTFPDGSTEKPAGNVIAGSNFVPFGEVDTAGGKYKVLYQTGESVAIIGNYRAYSTSLTDGSHTYAYNGETYNYSNIWADTISDKAEAMALGFEHPDVSKRIYFGLTGPVDYNTEDGGKYRLYKGIEEKSDYLKYAYDEAVTEGEGEYYRFDSAAGIKNVVYSLGAYPEESGGVISVTAKNHNLGVFALLSNLLNEYNYFVNELGNPALNYGESGTERNSVSEFINEDVAITNTTASQAISTGEVFYKGESAIAIGSGADTDPEVPSDAVIYDTDNISRGIIYTTKDVYITGSLTYNGTIITKGNIHINGDAPKSINNDPSGSFNIAERAYKDYIDIATSGIGDIFRVNTTTEFVESTGDSNYINFREIITASNWRRMR